MVLRYCLSVFLTKPNLEQLEKVRVFVERVSETPVPRSICIGNGKAYQTEVTTTEKGMRNLVRGIEHICGTNVELIDVTNPEMRYVKQGKN